LVRASPTDTEMVTSFRGSWSVY